MALRMNSGGAGAQPSRLLYVSASSSMALRLNSDGAGAHPY